MAIADTATRPPGNETRPSQPRPYARLVIGGILIVIGALWLLDIAGIVAFQADVVFPAALTVIGLALVIRSFDGPHPGLVVAGIFMTAAVLLASAVPFGTFDAGVGEREFRITNQQQLDRSYELGLGKLVLDLTDLDIDRRTELSASVGAGELLVRLPEGLPVAIDASAGAGDVHLLGETANGLSVQRTYRGDAGDEVMLVLDLEVGTGSIEVTR